MKRIALVMLLLALIAPAVLVAQGPPPPMGPDGPGRPHGMGPGGPGGRIPMAFWRNSEVAQRLGLTDQQVKQIEKNFDDHRMKLVDMRAAVEKEELKLEQLMNSDQLNEQAISSQLDALIAARGRLEKANAMMGVQMRKTLTPEQWTKLREMRRERWGRERMDGDRDRDRTPRPQRRGAPDGPNGPGGRPSATPEPVTPPPPGDGE